MTCTNSSSPKSVDKVSDVDKFEVNDILCFISTAISVKSNDFIINSCTAYYELTKIREAKELLFAYSNEKSIKRRGENCKKSEIQDIIEILRKYEETGVTIPKFLASSYDSMPPTTGFDLLAATLVDLIEQISSLKDEINSLKNLNKTNDITTADLNIIKDDIKDIKNSLNSSKKLKFQDIELNDSNTTKNVNRRLSCSSLQMSPLVLENDEYKNISKKLLNNRDTVSPSVLIKEINSFKDSYNADFNPTAPSLSQLNDHSFVECTSPPPKDISTSYAAKAKLPVPDQLSISRTQAQHKYNTKYHNNSTIIKGNKVTNNTNVGLKSAAKYLDVFLGNCDPTVDCDIICKHILDETGITTVDCEINQVKKHTKSFKIKVLAHDRDKLLDSKIWPIGIICKKFYNKKQSKPRLSRFVYNSHS